MDTLAMLRWMVERSDYEEAGLRGTISALPNNSLVSEWTHLANAHMNEANALKRAIAIITEADTLLPVLQQMAHSLALGEAGDASLKRLISLLSTEEAQT